ncbi:MAG: hypothetical protein ACOC6Q_00815 [Patescibacteria group bacterium]
MNDLRNIRQDLVAELQGISEYQDHIDAAENDEVREILATIRDEEKKHVAILMSLINRLDEVQAAHFNTESWA